MTLDLPAVPSPDLAAAAAAAARRDRLPAGALGVWGAVLDTLAAARGMASGSLAPQRPRLVVMAADHGVADLGVSAAVPTDTARRVADLTARVGLTATLAAVSGVGVRAVHAGPRSGRIDSEDALDAEQLEAAIATGRQIADAEVDEGADLLIG